MSESEHQYERLKNKRQWPYRILVFADVVYGVMKKLRFSMDLKISSKYTYHLMKM